MSAPDICRSNLTIRPWLALFIDKNEVTRNPAYYTIAQASKFVRPGSVRIKSNIPDNLPNVAFESPDGKMVLIV